MLIKSDVSRQFGRMGLDGKEDTNDQQQANSFSGHGPCTIPVMNMEKENALYSSQNSSCLALAFRERKSDAHAASYLLYPPSVFPLPLFAALNGFLHVAKRSLVYQVKTSRTTRQPTLAKCIYRP